MLRIRLEINTEPDNVAQLGDEVRIVRELELSAPMRLEPVRLPDATAALALMPLVPLARAIRSAVQWSSQSTGPPT